GLDCLELLALHHVEIAQDALGLGAHHAFDLLAYAVGSSGSVGNQLAELVEEPSCGLRHGEALSLRLWDATTAHARQRPFGGWTVRRGRSRVRPFAKPLAHNGHPRHPLSRHRSGRARNRPGFHPLVWACLYGRHSVRLALWPLSHLARLAMGRQIADD